MKKFKTRFTALLLVLVLSCTCIPAGLMHTDALVETDLGNCVTSDDFDNISLSKGYWSGTGTAVNDGDNNYIKFSKNGAVLSSYYEKYYRPTQMSISAKADSPTGIFLSPDYTKDGVTSKYYKGIWLYTYLSDNMLGLWGYYCDKDSTRILTDSAKNTKSNDSKYIRFSKNDWIDIDMQFDYSNWASARKVTVNYNVTGKIYGIMMNNVNWFAASEGYSYDDVYYEKNGVTYHIGDSFTFENMSYTFTFEGADYDAYLQLTLGNPSGNATFFVDNYSAQYDANHAVICKYIDGSRGVLTGTDNSDTAMSSAAEGYLALSDENKDIIKEQYPEAVKKMSEYADNKGNDTVVSKFKTDYEILLNLESESINPDYEQTLNAALEAYSDMSDSQKLVLYNAYLHLKELRTALDYYVIPREEGDYSDWIEDFESGTTKNWTLTTRDNDTNYNYYAETTVVDDPDKAGNKVLYFNQSGGFMLLPNSATWPSKGAMTNVSYRFKGSNVDISYRHKFYVYYIDSENYAFVSISGAKSTYLVTVSGGLGSEKATTVSMPLNITDWMDISVIYNHKTYKFTFTAVDSEGNSIVWGGSIPNSSGRFAIGQQRNAGYSSYGWVDDITVEFTQGDWDVDDQITEIEPYYSGNVWMEPGDVVTITGENLGKNVSDVKVIRVPDAEASQIGTAVNYPAVQAYDYEPEADKNSRKLLNAQLLEKYTFTNEDTVPIEQLTVDSVKFRIPKTLQNGIYAVKLTNKSGGEDAIIVVNNPHLSYTFGSDGGSTPAGGDLRIFGRKIVFDDYTKTRVAIIDPNDGVTKCILTPYKSEDKYSIHVMLPSNLTDKEYEVYVHNGYGDNSNWSRAGKIKVSPDVRSTWSQKIFDVTDYGASGDLKTNDTPAFIAAFEAAAQNGGGIVYAPAGVYTVIHTLTIPNNVSFRGDGIEKTHIIYDVSTWDIGDARTLISANGNVEICDLSIYGSRRKHILYINGDTLKPRENIYVHDIRVKIYGLTETLSAGAGNVGYDGVHSVSELIIMLKKELTEYLASNSIASFYMGEWRKDQYNIQLYNIDCYFDEAERVNGIKIGGYYNYLSNIQVKEGSFGWPSGLTYDYGIMENCNFGYDTQVGLQGNNWYFAHNTYANTTMNNRESSTTDGGCSVTDMIIRLDTTSSSGCVYEVVSTPLTSDLSGRMIMVASGQGYSQVRTIVTNTSDRIVVDTPFAVAPNRNSRCFVHNKRTNLFYVENKIINAGAFGTYGSMIDAVFDGNSFEQAAGYNMNSYRQFVWGISMINSDISDAFYNHGTSSISSSQDNTGYWGVFMHTNNSPYAGAMHNILIRNLDFRDGANISVNLMSVADCFKDMVIQGNTFTDASSAVIFSGANNSQRYLDGWLLADNEYINCKNRYNDKFKTAYNSNSKNKVGDFKIKFLDEGYVGTVPNTFGDANGDGSFTLKDVTYTQYYLIEKISVDNTASFVSRADVTGDGIVDLRDVNLMRKAIVAGGWENIEMPDISVPEVTYVVTLMNAGEQYAAITVKENGTYEGLSAVAAPAAPTGKVFDGWYTAETGGSKVTAASTIVQNAAHNLYARFVNNTPVTYTLTYISDGAVIGTKTITAGQTYGTLPQPQKSGYTLKGWYLNSAGTGDAISITDTVLSMNYNIYAVWQKNESDGDVSGDLVKDEDIFG